MRQLKVVVLILVSIGLNYSCKTTKEKNLKTNLNTKYSSCPSDGICSFEVLKNRSLEIKKDDIGALYPILTKGNTHVLKFEYKRNEIPNTQDGNYSEIVYIEVPEIIKNTEVSNKDLSKYKTLFARLCFCRGQTGYYHITKGNMYLNKIKKEEYNLQLDFKTEEVPQIITYINENFSLKKRLN